MLPQRFGRYVLLERIGAGGTAVVYRAHMLGTAGFSKQVAVKLVLPELAEDPSATAMLVDEAHIASGLCHPNIAQVLDLGNHEGQYFIGMEFVAGQPLSRVIVRALQSGPRLPLPFCLHTTHQALAGLVHAHRQKNPGGESMGIIHRDVSPQNIMVSYSGNVKLLDFGIARARDRAVRTHAGVLRGKPGYMSPDVLMGGEVTQQLDIYAMGVVLHELIAMRRLHGNSTDLQIIAKVTRGEFPRFDELGLEVPAPVQDLVYRALQPDPTERWTTSWEMLASMEELTRTLSLHWSAEQTAELMVSLFAGEIQKEEETSGRFHATTSKAVASELSQASEAPLSAVASTLPGAGPPNGASLPATAPTTRWAAVAAVGLLALAGTLHFLREPTKLSRAPTVASPPQDLGDTHPARPSVASGDAEPPPLAGPAVVGKPVSIPSQPLRDQPVGGRATEAGDPHGPSVAPPTSASSGAHAAADSGRVAPRRGKAAAAQTTKKGKLTIQSKPWGKVFIDGQDTGKFTPLVEMSIPAGKHHIRLVNDAVGLSDSFVVVVRADQTVVETRTLR